MKKEDDIIVRLSDAKPAGLIPDTDPHRRSRFITAALAARTEPTGSDRLPSHKAGLRADPLLPGRRAGTRRRLLVGAVASVLTIATAIVVASVVRISSAQAEVTNAAQHTSGQTFRVATTIQGDGGSPVHAHGEFDPARRIGRIQTDEPIGRTEVRYIGDLEYRKNPNTDYMNIPRSRRPVSQTRKPWIVTRVPAGRPSDLQALIDNPRWALKQLQTATHVRRTGQISGPGWTGHRYVFTNPGKTSAAGRPAHGTVDVDVQSRVRQLTFTLDEYTKDDAGLHHGWLRGTIAFSDYGTEVSVAVPPADQVTRLAFPPGHRPHPGVTITIHAPQSRQEPRTPVAPTPTP